MTGYGDIEIVEESERDEEWVKRSADRLIAGMDSDIAHQKRTIACRRMYNDGQYTDSYDYLYQTVTKKIKDECGNENTVTLVPPAKVRHIPIIKPMIRRLVSEEKDRPAPFAAYMTDANGTNSKEDLHIEELNQRQELILQQRLMAFQQANQLMQLKEQAAQEMAGTPEGQQIAQAIQMEMAHLRSVMRRPVELTDKELAKIRHYYDYDHKDIEQVFAELCVSYHINHQHCRHIFNRNFEEKLVTGNEHYFVDWEPGMADPTIEQAFFENLYLPYNENVMFTSEHSWCVMRQHASLDNIVSSLGHGMGRKELAAIMADGGWEGGNIPMAFYTPEGIYVGEGSGAGRYPATNRGQDTYTVYRVYFKVPAAVRVLISPNNNRPEALPHIKRLDEEEYGWYSDRPEKLKNKKLETRYRQDLYRAIRVGGRAWLAAGKAPVQLRSGTHKSRVELPIIGYTSSYFYSPSSLIWETRDIQELYNILYYQQELLVVLSGVKGIMVDMSQLMNGMEPHELIYYMRQGIIPLETLDEDGNPKNNSFNQFNEFDQTISPGIQYIQLILNSLKGLASEITGVNDVRMGVVRSTDQVGTSQLAHQNSSLTTEHYFQEHELLMEMAMTRLANLCRFAYKDGKKADFVNGDKIMERMRIPPGGMKGTYRLIMKSGKKEMKMLAEMQQAARMKFQTGQMAASEFLSILASGSITETRKLIQDYERLAIEAAKENRQAEGDRISQLEQQKAELDMRSQQMMAQVKAQLEEIKGGVEMAKEQASTQRKEMELSVSKQIAAEKVKAQVYDTDVEAEVEREYLEFQKLELAVNNRNHQTAMLLDTIKEQLNSRSKEKIKD